MKRVLVIRLLGRAPVAVGVMPTWNPAGDGGGNPGLGPRHPGSLPWAGLDWTGGPRGSHWGSGRKILMGREGLWTPQLGESGERRGDLSWVPNPLGRR